MRKTFAIITTILAGLMLTGSVFAATNVSVQMEQPKTPTNINELKLTVVTLDRLGRSVTVKCYKKGPSDGGFIQFGSDIVITPNGGNSVTCDTNSSIITNEGTYAFQATADAGDGAVTSNTVSVLYSTSGPGTPINYSKETANSCDYKIKFRTADDGGKTVKVEVYRSENTSFGLDAGTRVDTLSLGSNTDGQSITTKPNCSKTYFFAVRAFDINGNGSGSIGDVEVHTTTTGTTTTGASGVSGSSSATAGSAGAAGGAIAGGNAGNVLGTETGPTGGSKELADMISPTPTESMSPTASPKATTKMLFGFPQKNVLLTFGGVIILVILGLLAL